MNSASYDESTGSPVGV